MICRRLRNDTKVTLCLSLVHTNVRTDPFFVCSCEQSFKQTFSSRLYLMRHRIVGQALDGVIVRVLEDALQLGGPDDDALVGASGRKPLAVAGVRHAVHVVLVT
jgi:hypothetical protein